MPWFKIDDSSHSHPKFRRAGNAAIGLWVRCGAYSAQHLTEGQIPGELARDYGTEPQIRKLVKVGLWHEKGHSCDRCPQPTDADGFVIHDFFEGGRNVTKAQHEANKKAAAERAAKSRSGKKAPRIGADSDPNRTRIGLDSDPNRDGKDPQFSDSAAGQEALSQRTPADGAAHAHAAAMPYRSTSYGSTAAAAAREEGIPDPLGELKQRLAAAGLGSVAWDLRTPQWIQARDAVDRVGVAVMVEHAVNAARLKGAPVGASAWVAAWASLQPPPPPGAEVLPQAAGAEVLPFAPPGAKPSTTDQRVAGVYAVTNQLKTELGLQ
jgi:hypothetical protein